MAETGAERTEQRDTEAPRGGAQERPGSALAPSCRWRRCADRGAGLSTCSAVAAAAQFAELMRSGLTSERASRRWTSGAIWPALVDAGLRALLVMRCRFSALTFVAALARAARARRLEFLRPGADAAVLAAESRRRASAACSRCAARSSSARASPSFVVVASIAWVLLKGMTPQMLGLSSEPLQGAIGHAAALAGQALLVLCFGLVADRRRRRAVPALAALAAICKMTREEVQRGIQGKRRLARKPGRIRQAAARAGARPHDAGSAEGRRGDHQPDALRRGAALRREAQCARRSWWPRART